MNKHNLHTYFDFSFCKRKYVCFVFYSLFIVMNACQKDLELKYGMSEIKQVIIANLSPGSNLYVNISKSKHPEDFGAVDFLMDCKVDVFEDGVFKETMPFILKDTLSGFGYYTSSFKLQQNRTYKIVSTHAELGIAEATEYLPPNPQLVNFALIQHADSAHPNLTGKYIIALQDSAGWKNYYYFAAFYKVLKPTVNNSGDTIYKYDFIWNIPSYTPEIPNISNYNRSFITDAGFDGQQKTFNFDFPSQYNNIYKEILLIIEISNTGKNYYDWNIQQIPLGTDYLNEGQYERINLKSNIINGYGHFTANSSTYIGIPIK